MTSKRLDKFKKLQSFTHKQLELIQLELAGKQAELSRLRQTGKQLQSDLSQLQRNERLTTNLTVQRETLNRLMISQQQKMDDHAKEIQSAESQLKEIIERYQQQDIKVKSWEKLVEKETVNVLWEQSKREFDNADERFLSTSNQRKV